MSENMKVLEKFKKDVQHSLRSIAGKNCNVKMYEKLALKLSKLAKKTPAWSWRYVQGVYHGTIEPGKKFLLALDLYYSPSRKRKWLPGEWKITRVIGCMARETKRLVLRRVDVAREEKETRKILEWLSD